MKRLFVILFSLGLAVGASAQRYGHGGRYYGHSGFYRPRVSIGIGTFAPYYGYGYYPGYSYPPVYSTRPSKLQMHIADIKADYKDRIWSARHDKSVPRSERKKLVHELKHERDMAIMDARNNYYKNNNYHNY